MVCNKRQAGERCRDAARWLQRNLLAVSKPYHIMTLKAVHSSCAFHMPKRLIYPVYPGTASSVHRSDGLQPHLISIQFQRKMPLLVRCRSRMCRVARGGTFKRSKSSPPRPQELHMHVDYKLDESYTPKQVSVRAGHTYHDLKVRTAEPCTRTPGAKAAGVAKQLSSK